MREGIVEIYTGDGKGKTTAAIGLAVRAYGKGLKVAIFQMLKAPGNSGEYIAINQYLHELTINSFGTGQFIINREPTDEEINQAKLGWDKIKESILSGEYDLVIIDEVSHVINCHLIELNDVVKTIRNKPKHVEVVLTGRNMPKPLLEIAELVTEMKAVKHPYTSGISAREGIEF